MKAYWKDITRTVKKSKKRFFSILAITALGVTMFTGLSAGCRDLRKSADELFDRQKLYDIRVVSTLGLTREDVNALAQAEGVKQAEGAYSEMVYTRTADKRQRAEVRTLKAGGLSQPMLLEGTLPRSKTEIAVTENYCKDSGNRIGDTLILEQEPKEDADTSSDTDALDVGLNKDGDTGLKNTAYTITAIVLDATDLIADEGAAAYRATESVEYFFFVTEDAVDSGIYTAVNLTVSGAEDLLCYSKDYEKKVDRVTDEIEQTIKEQREQARYESVTKEAQKKLADAQKKADDEFSRADRKIAKAKTKLKDGRLETQNGWKKLWDGQTRLKQQEKKAKQTLAEAKRQLADGFKQLQAGERKLAKSEKELKEGQKQLSQGKKELSRQKKAAEQQFRAAEKKLEDARTQAVDGRAQMQKQEESMRSSLQSLWPENAWQNYVKKVGQAYQPVTLLAVQEASQEQIGEAERRAAAEIRQEQQALSEALTSAAEIICGQIDQALAGLDKDAADYEQRAEAYRAQKLQLQTLPTQAERLGLELGKVNAMLLTLDGQSAILQKEQEAAGKTFSEAENTIKKKEAALDSGKSKLAAGRAKREKNREKLQKGQSELNRQERKAQNQLNQAKETLSAARSDLEEGESELEKGERELAEKETELTDAKKETQEKLADAQKKISEIDRTKWYVQDRSSISSYTTIESDAASIETIGTVFPILFLSVAILISLTTITRMVEEERGLIGTYKALGFRDGSVYGKYLLYAVFACLLGGLLGDICGFIILPKFLFTVFSIMYKLPSYPILFHAGFGIGGILIFEIGVVLAAFLACHSELRQMPAVLMRPKAPRAGSRVFLERIPFLWKHTSFLNKVTMRNLFRYKKRLLMTVGGIMGCTALVLVGMAIKNSVTELMPNQYEHVYRYDLMTVSAAEDNETAVRQLSGDANVKDSLNVQIGNLKVTADWGGDEESVQLIVVPRGFQLNGYIQLETPDGEPVELGDDGIYVTENLSSVMGFKQGAQLDLQTLDLEQGEAKVSAIVRNYLGNTVYMTQDCYERLFGDFEPNGMLIHLADSCTDHTAFAEQAAKNYDVISALSTQSMREEFETSFSLINSVVALITFLAAGLAFVVLFTLATTNISERERELATIKVLGFFDREVHLYVNKETVILTLIGIGLGLPVGRFFSGLLTSALKMPAVHFAVYVYPVSYLIAAGLTLVFALAVNLITNRSLDGIDMVDALKSIE